jgi:hypothetical protein
MQILEKGTERMSIWDSPESSQPDQIFDCRLLVVDFETLCSVAFIDNRQPTIGNRQSAIENPP